MAAIDCTRDHARGVAERVDIHVFFYMTINL